MLVTVIYALYIQETYSSLNGFFEYFIFKNSMKVFNATAIELPIISTMSFLPIPYITQNERPMIKTIMNRIDTSSDFLVLNAFLIWGTVLETAKPVAIKPIIGNKKSTIVSRLPHFV